MKWAVVGLLVLGLLAGAMAAALVVSMRMGPQLMAHAATQPSDITIAVINGDLAAAKIIHADAIATRTVRAAEAPAGALTREQAVGRMTTMALVAGEVVTDNKLVPTGSEQEFVAMLQPGMRYMTIALSTEASLRSWIYPGCRVDVLVAFRLPSAASGEALSTTLLRGVTVAAVDNHNLVHGSEPKAGAKAKVAEEERSRGDHATLVTLLVNAQQAESLKLAVDHGTISLALRNPTDENVTASEGVTVLQGGRLAQMGTLLGPNVGGTEPVQSVPPTTQAAPPEPRSAVPAAPVAPAPRPPWQIQIFHGDKVEIRTFDVSESSLLSNTARVRAAVP